MVLTIVARLVGEVKRPQGKYHFNRRVCCLFVNFQIGTSVICTSPASTIMQSYEDKHMQKVLYRMAPPEIFEVPVQSAVP